MGHGGSGRHCVLKWEAIKLICMSSMNELLAVTFRPIMLAIIL